MKKVLVSLVIGVALCVVVGNDAFAGGDLYSTSLYSDANLVAYYRLENVNDSKNSYTLTNNNSVAFNAAAFNNGADFGSNNTTKSLFTSNTLGVGSGACAFSLWIKIYNEVATNGSWNLINLVNNTAKVWWMVRYNDTSGIKSIQFVRVRTGIDSVDVSYNIALGTSSWYHIVGTYDGTNIRLYANGSLVAGPTAASGVGTGTRTEGFSISWEAFNNANWASAIIDDVGVFTRALTSTEVSTLYNGFSTPTPTITPTPTTTRTPTPTQTPTATNTPDIVPPVVPVITSSNWDFITGKVDKIKGTGENGTTLTFYDRNNNIITGSTQWDGSGNFTFTPTTPLDPGSSVYVNSVDTANNTTQSKKVVTVFEAYYDISRDVITLHGVAPGNSMRMDKDTAYQFNIAANDGMTPDPDKPVTVRAYVRYNSAYGSAAKPKLTLSGLGIPGTEVGQYAVATGAALNDWQQLTVTGTPGAKGMLTLRVETFSTAPDAQSWIDDITVVQE